MLMPAGGAWRASAKGLFYELHSPFPRVAAINKKSARSTSFSAALLTTPAHVSRDVGVIHGKCLSER